MANKKKRKRLGTFCVRTTKATGAKSSDKARAGVRGSDGTPLRGLYSFVEDFRRDTLSANEVRRARFGRGWAKSANGEWVPLEHAKFTASNSPTEARETID